VTYVCISLLAMGLIDTQNLSIQDVINAEYAMETVSIELSPLSWYSATGGMLNVHPYAPYASIQVISNRL